MLLSPFSHGDIGLQSDYSIKYVLDGFSLKIEVNMIAKANGAVCAQRVD